MSFGGLGGDPLDWFVVPAHFGFVILILFTIFISDSVEIVDTVIFCDSAFLVFASSEWFPDNGVNGVYCVCSCGSAHPWS